MKESAQFKKKNKFIKVAQGLVSFHKKLRAMNFSEIREQRKKSVVSYFDNDLSSPFHNNSITGAHSPY